MRDNFVDKVYDKYISSDFSYGLDNLNPKREISLTGRYSMDNQINEIYAELSKRVNKVKRTVADLSGEIASPIYKGNSSSESMAGVSTARKNNIIKNTGSLKTKLVVVPDFENDDDPLAIEAELYLLEMSLQSYIGDSNDSEDDSDADDALDAASDSFYMDCSGVLRNSDGSVVISDDTETLSTETVDEDDSDSDSEDDSSSDSSSISTTDSEALSSALEDALAAQEAANIESEKSIAQCAKAEIGYLKVILSILKIVKMLKQLLEPALEVVMQTLKLVMLASQAWINPSVIPLIIQRVVGLVLSMIMGIVATLVAELFSMLGLDCMTSQVADVMDEVREALGSVSNILSEINPTAIAGKIGDIKNLMTNAFDAVNDSIADAKASIDSLKDKDTWKDMIKSTLSNLTKQYLGLDLTSKDLTNFFSNPKYRKRILNALKKIQDPEVQTSIGNIEQVIETAMSVPDQVSTIMATIKKQTASLDTEMRILSSFKNLKTNL